MTDNNELDYKALFLKAKEDSRTEEQEPKWLFVV